MKTLLRVGVFVLGWVASVQLFFMKSDYGSQPVDSAKGSYDDRSVYESPDGKWAVVSLSRAYFFTPSYVACLTTDMYLVEMDRIDRYSYSDLIYSGLCPQSYIERVEWKSDTQLELGRLKLSARNKVILAHPASAKGVEISFGINDERGLQAKDY